MNRRRYEGRSIAARREPEKELRKMIKLENVGKSFLRAASKVDPTVALRCE